MVTKESYKALMQRIIDKHLIEESLIFEEIGDAAIDSAFEGDGVNHEAKTSEALAAADFSAASLIISIVPAIFTCYKLILEISKLKEEKKPIVEEEWRRKLENQLLKHKLPQKQAKIIADDFAKELIAEA